mgnify:CR=1 FL=1
MPLDNCCVGGIKSEKILSNCKNLKLQRYNWRLLHEANGWGCTTESANNSVTAQLGTVV